MNKNSFICTLVLAISLLANTQVFASGEEDAAKREAFSKEEILEKARTFFGSTTEGLAEAIEKVFEEHGEPNAYILGEEASGALIVGARYGSGTLVTTGDSEGSPIFWKGPSVGFDIGGNAASVFTLIYNLDKKDDIYQRFPGVEGSLYFVAGVGLNYLRSDDTVIAPIRTGVGWRQGASVGYLHFTKKRSWVPF